MRESLEFNYKNLYLENELSSISNFILCYTNLRVLDSASIFLNLGIEKLSEYTGQDNIKKTFNNNFLLSSIEIDYYNEKYYKSLKTIEKLSKEIDVNNEKRDLRNLYLFKGLNNIKIKNEEEGIKFLLKADSLLELNTKSLVPYHRAIYKNLLEFYDKNGDVDHKMIYLNKLLNVDSIIKSNYLFFEATLIKDFETPELIKKKEIVIAQLNKTNKSKSTILWWVVGLFGGSLLALGYYINRQQLYKRRFDVLILQNGNIDKKGKEDASNNLLSKDIITGILEQLQVFESKKDFLSQDITLHSLAKAFGTNYKYLSKVINLYKEKRFSSYINDLRVVYAYYELKTNSKFKRYSIKAIAKECGFNSAESFSKAFYKKFGIYPSFYIKQLDKNTNIL